MEIETICNSYYKEMCDNYGLEKVLIDVASMLESNKRACLLLQEQLVIANSSITALAQLYEQGEKRIAKLETELSNIKANTPSDPYIPKSGVELKFKTCNSVDIPNDPYAGKNDPHEVIRENLRRSGLIYTK